jgi:hypothetical protein
LNEDISPPKFHLVLGIFSTGIHVFESFCIFSVSESSLSVRPKICRIRLIVCQVQVVLELWRITLDQWLIPIIIRWWSSNSSLDHEHVLVVKLLHGLVPLLTKSFYTELLLQYQNIGNATETLPSVAETIYHMQHVLLPYFFFWQSRDGIHML